ncbi:MAG TPA: NAAT family transporter [Thermoplasmata archaeon]|nr:NAAT family transporter [Thermoplasmata archaeon]
MSLNVALFAEIVLSIFAIVDPLGTLPFYVTLTEGFDAADRSVIVRRAVLVLGGVLALFALLGRFLFAVFGLSLAAFEIAGGALLFLVAFDMLRGELTQVRLTPQDRDEAIARRDELSVVPLGIPLLAGPGAISVVMIYEGNAGSDPLIVLATFVAILVTCALTFVILRFGDGIFRSMGRVGVMAMTRVLGLILAAVGVQFVIDGVLSVAAHV